MDRSQASPEEGFYAIGNASHPDLPVTAGSFLVDRGLFSTNFLAKFDDGGHLVSSTFLGGSDFTSLRAMAVGDHGHVYLVGELEGDPYVPLSDDALSKTPEGVYNGFLSSIDMSVELGTPHVYWNGYVNAASNDLTTLSA